jgi:MFS transporter, DHA2 family, methylenomycin A resistance protein
VGARDAASDVGSIEQRILAMTMTYARTARTLAAPALILFTTSLGVLIAQLDSSVVNLAVKHIGNDLGAGVSQLQWVLDAYNLAYATLLLTGGTLGDLYGRRRVFMCGVVLITLGSIVCGLAPNGATLIAGRTITGLGAALELPTSLAILTVAYSDPKERGRAIGIWASCNGLALGIGPTVGGFLVDSAGWRSIFLLIVPVCALALVLAWRAVPESADPKGRRLDLPGQILAIVCLGALAFTVIEAPHWGLTSIAVLASAAVSLVAGIAFVRIESGQRGVLVPLDIFGNRAFSASLLVAGCMTFGMYAMLFLTPLYLQSVRGASAFVAGLQLLPLSLVFIVISQYSGRLADKFGARAVMAAGMALMGAGLLILCAVSKDTSLALIESAMLVIGAGLGLNTGPVVAVAVANVQAARSGMASGLVNTTRMVGATLGIAVLGGIFAAYAGQTGQTPEGMVAGLRMANLGGAFVELTGAMVALVFIHRDSMRQRQR